MSKLIDYHELDEQDLSFYFLKSVTVKKFDEWRFLSEFQKAASGQKAVDFLVISEDKRTVWLLEVKDFRDKGRPGVSELVDIIGKKVACSLGCLAAARLHASDQEQRMAAEALNATQYRIVFHFEQPPARTRLKPKPIAVADLAQKMRAKYKAIDPHPKLTSIGATNSLPWRVEEKKTPAPQS